VKAPSFYDPEAVADVWVERAGRVAEEASRARVAPASSDRVRIAAFGIDCQIGFATPGSSLFVPGAVEDTRRTIGWLYENLEKLTELYFSLDTHSVFQIFHPGSWADAAGAAPPPFTTISTAGVRGGLWRPAGALAGRDAECFEYVERLERAGRYVLTIWPYHALLGGVSHALVPALMEAAMFHALARSSPTHFETKGEEPMTENYSVLSPEVTELGGKRVGAFNDPLFDALARFDRVYVFGQAKSHCVLSTLRDIEARARKTDPSLMKKIWILEDATSPVPPPPLDPLPLALDFPRVAERAFAELREAGMNVVKTTDPIPHSLRAPPIPI
jgi:nicotinamidase-related amidase